MRAAAAVVAEPGGCTRLRSEPPLTLRRTPDALYLVGSAAGPVGGDDLRLDISVTDGAALAVRSAAAQLVYPGARGEPSRLGVDVEVGRGASVDWQPEATVLVRGADHRASTRVTLGPLASFTWREVVVLGRTGQTSGSVRLRLRVEREGVPLLCNDLALGPAWPYAAGPAGAGPNRVVGTLLVIGGDPIDLPAVDGVRAGACLLADDAMLITALADDVEPVVALFSRCTDPS